jgi:chondroitin 4-sulfotransferase 11
LSRFADAMFRVRRRRPEKVRPGFMVIALPSAKVVYHPIPKVACSSVMSACVDALEIDFPPGEWKPEVFQTRKWDHLFDRPSIVAEDRPLPRRFDKYWSFAFVRNPWDRLVSCYSEKIRPDGDPENFINGVSRVLASFGVFEAGMSFERFAREVAQIPDEEAEPHFLSQHKFIVNHEGDLIVDFLGRFETLDQDFDVVRQRIRAPVELPHLLRSPRGHYRDYYSSDLADIVGERYAEDIARFGYAF